MWSAGITPLAPQPSLPLAALPYTHSKEEEKVTVAIFSPNTTSFAVALLACLSSPLGIIATLASSSYQADDLKYQLQDARAGILLVHPSLLGVAEEALRDEAPGWKDRVYILGDSLGGAKVAGYRDFSELRVGGEEGQRWREGTRPRADDTAFLCYSSGTVSTRARDLMLKPILTLSSPFHADWKEQRCRIDPSKRFVPRFERRVVPPIISR